MDNFLQLSYLGKTHFIVAIKSLTLLVNADELVTSNTLTERLGIESSFIRKVLAKLMQENIVEGFGGRYGGYKLIVNPEKTTLYDIYVAIAKDAHPKDEEKALDSMDHMIIEIVLESQAKIKEILSKYSISDLINGKHM
ncbi:RrF2 family transcriptional regulator [Alkalihalobacillus pseudalcaliphilus]|uniref:RrF2 family transcriptional regulator n=1 Tax=Alkalihalobacillus pseudalcaliphilus TaxID=79884 RepID=UPI00069EC050|nr:Rrf2 family transcriptional regulator [Alkalihalobacillus pseudalcaliphilus]